MDTLTGLAAHIAAHGSEIQPCPVRWLPDCWWCGSRLKRHDTYEIPGAGHELLLCGVCAARLVKLARNRLDPTEADGEPDAQAAV